MTQPHFQDQAAYETALKHAQRRLLSIQQAYLLQRRRAVIVFEGTDAAGKGGAIKRFSEPLDPRFCKVWPIGAPNPVEREQHWLARFWDRLPTPGMIAVFDRSWYGRVLVERAEGLIAKPDWSRAYDEINEFERMLTADGVRLVKLFLTIDPDEQQRRFIERLTDPNKRWKIGRRDFEARHFAKAYRKAEAAMLERTDHKAARWAVIDGHWKWRARVEIINHIADHLSHGVDLSPPPLDPELAALARDECGWHGAAD